MNFEKFMSDVLGKSIDMDGFPKNQPYQCVDLIKYFNSLFNKDLNILCSTTGYAKDWANNKESNGLLNYFNETQVNNMITGTLVVYGDCKQAPQSHICFFIEDNGNGTFKALGQNQGQPYVTVNNLRYEGIIGAFIPKQLIKQSNTTENNNQENNSKLYKCIGDMYVRYNAGLQYSIKLVKDLTEDGRKNATSSNPNAYAVYKAGTVFTARNIINKADNSIWAETPSGYVCIRGASGREYCIPC